MRDGRLLVLGDYPIGYANGIGETLANLLADHPDASLFQLHPDHLQPLHGEGRGQASTFVFPRRPASWPAKASSLYRPILKLRQRAEEDRLCDRAAAIIRERQIEAVLCYPVTPWVLFAAVRLRRMFPKVRFVFYVMDDWEGHHTCFGLPFTAKRRAALAEIVATSDARFACSTLMQHDYERRFGNAWSVLHKGVNLGDIPPAPAPWRFTNILYTGAMNMFRFDAVLAFAEGLRRYREQSRRDITLTLLGTAPDGDYAPALAPYSFVRMAPWVGNDECRRRMVESDVLYLPLSFEPKLDRIANLAMPTKFSEYLASGRPAIFHVSGASEVHAQVSRAGLPLLLDTTDPDAICAFLAGAAANGVDMRAYHGRAGALLRSEFDQSVLRRRLEDACFPCAS
jgi:hypothetical protein